MIYNIDNNWVCYGKMNIRNNFKAEVCGFLNHKNQK